MFNRTRATSPLMLLMMMGCGAPATRPSDSAARSAIGDTLSLASFGISLPTPRGWIKQTNRTGSIGCMLLAQWLRPHAPNSNAVDASIVLVLAHPQAFAELPPGVGAGAREFIDGKRAIHLSPMPLATSSTRPADKSRATFWGFGEKFVVGYRFEAHPMHFYLLLDASPDDDVAGRTLNERAHGIRWQEPAAADQALSLSGDFECVAPRTDLYFDVPYPFWNNPFRGMFFDPYSLRERDDGNVFFQVDELKDVRDIDAAKKAAADKPLYYENHGWDLHWQRVSDHPDIYIGVSDPTPRDEEGNIYVMKMIVARAADGRFFRIAFNLHAAPESVGRYALLVDEVAKTVTTIAPYGSSRK
jgi:hypothetical protein